MRRFALSIILLLPAVAGCLGEPAAVKARFEPRTIVAVLPSDVVPGNRTPDMFYLVLVSGSETAQRIKGQQGPTVACDRDQPFQFDRTAKTISYESEHVSIDPAKTQVIVVVDYVTDTLEGRRGCGASTIEAFAGRARFDEAVREDLTVELVVEAQNGFVSYNTGYFVPLGKKIHVNLRRVAEYPDATFHVSGDFEVTNLGLWPISGLRPV